MNEASLALFLVELSEKKRKSCSVELSEISSTSSTGLVLHFFPPLKSEVDDLFEMFLMGPLSLILLIGLSSGEIGSASSKLRAEMEDLRSPQLREFVLPLK